MFFFWGWHNAKGRADPEREPNTHKYTISHGNTQPTHLVQIAHEPLQVVVQLPYLRPHPPQRHFALSPLMIPCPFLARGPPCPLFG